MLKVGSKNVPSIAIGPNVYDMRLLGQKVRVNGSVTMGYQVSVYNRYEDTSPSFHLTEDVTGKISAIRLSESGHLDMWDVTFDKSVSDSLGGWVFPDCVTLLGG